MYGEELIKKIVAATGLPEQHLYNDLVKMIEAEGLKKESVSLEDLRPIITKFMQKTIVAAKEQYS